MAQFVDALWDWQVFGRARLPLWSRFALELAPDLIVSPHLFDWPPAASMSGDVYTCAGRPRVVVLCARGDWHRAFVHEEVAPRVAEHVASVVVVEPEDDRATWLPDGRVRPLRSLKADLEAAWAPLPLDLPDFTALNDEASLRRWRMPEDPLPTGRLEEVPLRLWEALAWRGATYRHELVGGELPLLADLGSPAAAALTADQLLADASGLVGEPVRSDADGGSCGPVRVRRHDRLVEVRVRLSPADRRPVFAPQAREPGGDNDPSLLGVLSAGGDDGKTELMYGFSWSTVLVPSPRDAERLAARLKPQIEAWTGAPVRFADWPSRDEPETWVLSPGDRVLRVHVPMHREDLLPWRVLMTGQL